MCPTGSRGELYETGSDDAPMTETGIALPGAGRRSTATATGEVYDMRAMTAAHKDHAAAELRGGAQPAQQARVVVRVNDRGPFKDSPSSTSATPPRASSASAASARSRCAMTRRDPQRQLEAADGSTRGQQLGRRK